MTLFTDITQGPGATAAALANKTALSDLTLPQSARVITRIWVTAGMVGTFAVNKPLVGYVIVTSDDCDIEPLHIPIEPIAPYLSLGSPGPKEATKWVVNCPCPGGTKLSFDVVADAAPNAAPEICVNVEFSDGETVGAGRHLHMKAGEPAVSASTSDNGTANLDDIEIKASHVHMFWAYGAFTTMVADTSVVADVEVTSDDWAVAGPHKFSLNPNVGGDANAVGARIDLTKIETSIPFRVPGQKQTISGVLTMRDAVSTAPVANWGVVYE